jgi:hypothetical protein
MAAIGNDRSHRDPNPSFAPICGAYQKINMSQK